MPARQGVRGVLRAGPAAASAPQCQLQPGQGLYHEAHHQLPTNEETSKYWLVPVVVVYPLHELGAVGTSAFLQFGPKCEVSTLLYCLKIYLHFSVGV